MRWFISLLRFFQTNIVSTAIVLFLSVVMCLREGQQQQIDLIVPIILCVIALFVRIRYKPKRTLPRNQIIVASFIFVFVLASLFWSDDAGSTLFFFLRYLDAFLVYTLFYSYGTKDTSKQVIHALMALGIVALIASFIVASSTIVQYWMPSDYLIKFSYGHHPIIALLLFVYPMAFVSWLLTKKTRFLVLLTLFLIASVVTLSRLGVLIELLFSSFCVVVMIIRKQLMTTLLAIIVGILGLFCVLLFVFPYTNTNTLFSFLSGQEKTQNVTIARTEYMRQALVAFLERPIVGSGLGTFYLESMRLEKKVFSYVWTPHSLPLEQVSDMGVVGTGILWVFFALVIQTIFWRRPKNIQSQISAAVLMSGAGCIAVFSMVDIPFVYLLITLVFWMILGVLGGLEAKTDTRVKQDGVLYVTIGVLLVFSSVCFWFWPIRVKTAVFSLQGKNTSVALFFHKKNRTLLLPLAKVEYQQGNIQQADALYRTALTYDPFSADTYYPYFRFLTKIKQYEQVGRALTQLSLRNLPKSLAGDVLHLNLETSDYYAAYRQIFESDTVSGYASLYYQIGLFLLPTDSNRTEVLWRLANIAYPGYGHFYVEYANLLEYTFHDPERARQFLLDCQKDVVASGECKERLQNGVSEPGSLQEFIKERK